MKRTITLLALLLTVPSAAIASPRRSHTIYLHAIHMVTPLIGWGASDTAILHTSDGARTWRAVTPPLPQGLSSSLYSLPLDVTGPSSAWLAAPNTVGTLAPTIVYVFHTTNAGATWTRLPPLHVGRYSTALLQFIDPLHGWMDLIRGVGMSQISFDIYRTVDGARHWQRVLAQESFSGGPNTNGGLPECDCGQAFTYVTPRSGWMGGCYCGLIPTRQLFFHSADGGRTWRPSRLPLPARYRTAATNTGAPIFFSPRIAVLPVFVLVSQSRAIFIAYHATDAGASWHATTPIAVRDPHNPTDFADSAHGFLLDANRLLRTADGGRHWQTLRSPVSRDNVIALNAVSPSTVFILASIGSSNRTRLLETTNAGITWKTLS